MSPIGGYFELELRKGKEYHAEAIHINTGRNALEYILRTRKYCKIYLPLYSCEVILEPINKLGLVFEFYYIDKYFEPIFNYNSIKVDEAFLYINYFGLKDNFITKLTHQCKNLVIDNSQSFFSTPVNEIDTFYSARKFFGVPDGSYLYMEGNKFLDSPIDSSMKRCMHLIKRIELGAEAAYSDYKINENSLIGQPIKQMSRLTNALLANIDYNFIRKQRRNNFSFLHRNLSKFNELDLKLDDCSVPMVYPLLKTNSNLKETLIENKIFTATYWPNVLEWADNEKIEYKFAAEMVFLPIDQRYNIAELKNIVKLCKK